MCSSKEAGTSDNDTKYPSRWKISSNIASIGSGEAFWFAAVKPRERSGRNMARSLD